MEIRWSFPESDYAQRQGLSDSGIETFKGHPIRGLTREICQNSLDALKDTEKPVLIEFQRFHIRRTDFPDVESFNKALALSKETWSYEKSEKTTNFIHKAQKTLNDDSIEFLRISDFNTTGLRGSDQIRGSDWSNLIKSSGSSDKKSDAGGSFGIGKFAPFACSNLRTVFYSTLDDSGLEATQGVARLVSHKVSYDSEQETQGIGYYGDTDKHSPIKSHQSFSSSFIRNESGTDIFISGFVYDKYWKIELINEVLDSFLYAVLQGTLVVKVENTIINSESLPDIMKDYDEKISNKTKAYYKVLTDYAETHWFNEDFNSMGEISLGIRFDNENAVRRVAMIRKPWMKIFDLGSISATIPFTGVLIIKGQKLNEFLRKIENPEHTQWEYKRAPENQLETAELLLKNIRRLLKDKIVSLSKDEGNTQIDIEGAGDFFPFDDKTDSNKTNNEDDFKDKIDYVDLGEVENIKTDPNTNQDISREEKEEMINGGIIEEGEETYLAEHGDGHSSDEHNDGDIPYGVDEDLEGQVKKYINTKSLETKFIAVNKNQGLYRVYVKPETVITEGKISINKMDEQGKRIPVTINKAKMNSNALMVDRNTVLNISGSETSPLFIDIEVNENNYFSAEVKLHAVKK